MDRYGAKYGSAGLGTGTLQGFYTDVEESNSIGELPLMKDLVGHYLEPLARDIHVMAQGNTSSASASTTATIEMDGGRGAESRAANTNADDSSSSSSTIRVWASPYFVGNLTRHPSTAYMNARFCKFTSRDSLLRCFNVSKPSICVAAVLHCFW